MLYYYYLDNYNPLSSSMYMYFVFFVFYLRDQHSFVIFLKQLPSHKLEVLYSLLESANKTSSLGYTGNIGLSRNSSEYHVLRALKIDVFSNVGMLNPSYIKRTTCFPQANGNQNSYTGFEIPERFSKIIYLDRITKSMEKLDIISVSHDSVLSHFLFSLHQAILTSIN